MTDQKINPQDIIPEYWRDVHVDSKEALLFLGKNNLRILKQNWRYEERQLSAYLETLQVDANLAGGKPADGVKEIIDQKKKANNFIHYLACLMSDAEEKPHFACHRSSDYFNVGDEVMVLIPYFDEALPEKVNSFVSGKVINGYRHHNGSVSVYADTRVNSNDYCDGHGMGYGDSRPEILKKWEYEYLKTHPDYFQIWTKNASAEVNDFCIDNMVRAFAAAG